MDGFRKPINNYLKNTACLEIISNTNANFLNLHVDKARKTLDIKQLYLITHFSKQTLSLDYLLLMLNIIVELLNSQKTEEAILFSGLKFLLNGVGVVFFVRFQS